MRVTLRNLIFMVNIWAILLLFRLCGLFGGEHVFAIKRNPFPLTSMWTRITWSLINNYRRIWLLQQQTLQWNRLNTINVQLTRVLHKLNTQLNLKLSILIMLLYKWGRLQWNLKISKISPKWEAYRRNTEKRLWFVLQRVQKTYDLSLMYIN